MPRRFGVGTLLVVSAPFSALFAVTRALDLPLFLLAVVCLLLVVVGLMQMFVGPQRARGGSMFAGASLLAMYATAVFCESHRSELYESLLLALLGLLSITGAILGGTLIGYLFGTLVAGVFLLMDLADRWIHPARAAVPSADHKEAGVADPVISDAGES